jgi:hypothetical protein
MVKTLAAKCGLRKMSNTDHIIDHIVVKCLHEDCSITERLFRGLCPEHYALAVEFDLIDELPASGGRVLPYKPKATALGRRAPQGAPAAFIRDHADHQGDECLLWPFARTLNGYGQVLFEGRQTRAHRAICILAHGEPPFDGAEATHSCANGHLGCVNPKHLRWKTHHENILEMVSQRRNWRGGSRARS